MATSSACSDAYRGDVSIPVDIDDLKAALERFDSGYLLTAAEDRVNVVTVDPTPADAGLRIAAAGRGTIVNLAANPTVTLLFPPIEQHGHTLRSSTAPVSPTATTSWSRRRPRCCIGRPRTPTVRSRPRAAATTASR